MSSLLSRLLYLLLAASVSVGAACTVSSPAASERDQKTDASPAENISDSQAPRDVSDQSDVDSSSPAELDARDSRAPEADVTPADTLHRYKSNAHRCSLVRFHSRNEDTADRLAGKLEKDSVRHPRRRT